MSTDNITPQDALQIARQAVQRVNDLEEEIKDLKIIIEQKDRRIDELESEIKDLRQATQLIQHVEDAAAMDIEERAAVCIQTLVNEADGRDPQRASMTAREGLKALGGGIDRTSVYDVFRKAEELVGNDDVLWFQKEPRGHDPPSRLILDLDQATIPAYLQGGVGE